MKWQLSFSDRDSGLAVTPDGLRCQSRDQKAWQGGRATNGVVGPGKFYYETTVADEGLCRVGFSTSMVILSTNHISHFSAIYLIQSICSQLKMCIKSVELF